MLSIKPLNDKLFEDQLDAYLQEKIDSQKIDVSDLTQTLIVKDTVVILLDCTRTMANEEKSIAGFERCGSYFSYVTFDTVHVYVKRSFNSFLSLLVVVSFMIVLFAFYVLFTTLFSGSR